MQQNENELFAAVNGKIVKGQGVSGGLGGKSSVTTNQYSGKEVIADGRAVLKAVHSF